MHQIIMVFKRIFTSQKNCKKRFSEKILYKWYKYIISLQNNPKCQTRTLILFIKIWEVLWGSCKMSPSITLLCSYICFWSSRIIACVLLTNENCTWASVVWYLLLLLMNSFIEPRLLILPYMLPYVFPLSQNDANAGRLVSV